MTAKLKRRETAAAEVHFPSRTRFVESGMIAECANGTAREQRDPVDRRLRNRIIAVNTIVWIAIAALIVTFFF
jgi:hypothetical protein